MGLLDRLFGRKKRMTEEQGKAAEDRPLPQQPIVPTAEPNFPAVQDNSPPSPPENMQPISPEEIPTEKAKPPLPPPRTWDDVTQRKLDRYFARLREIYPDGVITRLNTGHKKLAERGAQLRGYIGMEGELDAFFALGGFTYRRASGGRPPIPFTQEDREKIHSRIRQLFSQGVPVVMAIRDADHRLYLDLRALAQREGKNVGDYLRDQGLMESHRPSSASGESSEEK